MPLLATATPKFCDFGSLVGKVPFDIGNVCMDNLTGKCNGCKRDHVSPHELEPDFVADYTGYIEPGIAMAVDQLKNKKKKAKKSNQQYADKKRSIAAK